MIPAAHLLLLSIATSSCFLASASAWERASASLSEDMSLLICIEAAQTAHVTGQAQEPSSASQLHTKSLSRPRGTPACTASSNHLLLELLTKLAFERLHESRVRLAVRFTGGRGRPRAHRAAAPLSPGGLPFSELLFKPLDLFLQMSQHLDRALISRYTSVTATQAQNIHISPRVMRLQRCHPHPATPRLELSQHGVLGIFIDARLVLDVLSSAMEGRGVRMAVYGAVAVQVAGCTRATTRSPTATAWRPSSCLFA